MRSPKRNIGGLSHHGFARKQQVRGNYVARGGGGLKNVAFDTSRTVCAVAASPVMCTCLHVCISSGKTVVSTVAISYWEHRCHSCYVPS